MPRHFILSADPSRFDLATRMIPGLEEIWRLTGNFRAGESQIRGGDIVYMMRTRGSEKDPPRLYGWGMVLSKAPLPAPDWKRNGNDGDSKGPTPHATRIRFLGVCDNPVLQSEFDADPVGKGIGLQQGGSQRISDEEAAFLTTALRKKGAKAPGDTLDKLTIARCTPSDDSETSDLQRVVGLINRMNASAFLKRPRAASEDSGPPTLEGSDLFLPAMFQKDQFRGALDVILPPDSFLYTYPPPLLGTVVSKELAQFGHWVCEISRVALGQDEPHPAALIAAMLTPEPTLNGSCAYELMRRAIPDMADARRKWLQVTSDPKSAQALFQMPTAKTRAKSKSRPRLSGQQKR